VDRIAARPARDHDATNRAFLRALQGSRARQVGARVELGRCRGSQERDRRKRRALRGGKSRLAALTPFAMVVTVKLRPTRWEPLNKSHMSRVSGAMASDARRRGAANSSSYPQAAQQSK